MSKNDTKPLVSVIVPNYNHAKFLYRRIESILNQKFQDFELILLDDCSSDNSKDILQSYERNPKVSHVVINSENTGNTFQQWIRGMRLAQGDFIWIAESDDYASPDFLSTVIPHLLESSNASFGYTGSNWVDENEDFSSEGLDYWPASGKVYKYNGRKFAQHNLFYINGVYNASMVVFRKSAFQKIDKSFTQFKYAGDWLVWFEMALQGSVIEIRQKLNYFRQHENKVSARSSKNNGGLIDTIYIGQKVCEKLNVSIYKKEMLRGHLYSVIRHIAKDKEEEKYFFALLRNVLGGNKRSYILFKINKFLSIELHIPFLSKIYRDKLNVSK